MRWIILVIIVCLISGASGCSILGYDFGSKSISGDDPSGLIMNFDSNKPPTGRVLSEGDNFQVGVNLKNTGDKSINGELCVSDSFLYKSYSGIPEPECRMVYLGGSREGVEASEQKIYFPNDYNGYYYTNLDQYFSQFNVISASFNYDINSVSSVQLCIKRDINVNLPDKITCPDVETISGSKINNLKAPIAVSSVLKDVVSSGGNARVKVEITLKKITDGEILSVVNYAVGFIGGPSFDCGSRSGQLLFDKNEKIIKCITTLNIGQEYINQPLQINLNYKFKKIISTQLELKKEV